MMTKDYLKNFSDLLPSELLEKAISLENMGINEFIWKWLDALDVIKILIDNRKFIFGGDVYILVSGKYKPKGDNWFINKTNYIATNDDLQKSKMISSDYIKSYVEKNGEDFYFSIVTNFN